MKARVLLTAFDAFGEDKINSAERAVSEADFSNESFEVFRLILPTVFEKSAKILIDAIEKIKPSSVICIGQAGGRAYVTPERIAINVDDARIADNDGNTPVDKPIAEQGPAAYFSTLPIKSIIEELNKNEIPASVSNTAGTFVCNHIFYSLMHYSSQKAPWLLGGFIHVPYLPEQAMEKNLPSLSLEMIKKAVEIAVRETVKATPMPL